MVRLDCMQEMITGYIRSPRGQEAIRNYLSSPEGKQTIDAYLSTPEGRQMAHLLLSRALERIEIPADVRKQVLAAFAEPKN